MAQGPHPGGPVLPSRGRSLLGALLPGLDTCWFHSRCPCLLSPASGPAGLPELLGPSHTPHQHFGFADFCLPLTHPSTLLIPSGALLMLGTDHHFLNHHFLMRCSAPTILLLTCVRSAPTIPLLTCVCSVSAFCFLSALRFNQARQPHRFITLP